MLFLFLISVHSIVGKQIEIQDVRSVHHCSYTRTFSNNTSQNNGPSQIHRETKASQSHVRSRGIRRSRFSHCHIMSANRNLFPDPSGCGHSPVRFRCSRRFQHCHSVHSSQYFGPVILDHIHRHVHRDSRCHTTKNNYKKGNPASYVDAYRYRSK